MGETLLQRGEGLRKGLLEQFKSERNSPAARTAAGEARHCQQWVAVNQRRPGSPRA